MTPHFLRPERVPYASVEIVPAAASLARPAQVFALFIENPATGYVSVKTFDSAFARGLAVIALSAQPVTLRVQDY
jgi:hypothetical protein